MCGDSCFSEPRCGGLCPAGDPDPLRWRKCWYLCLSSLFIPDDWTKAGLHIFWPGCTDQSCVVFRRPRPIHSQLEFTCSANCQPHRKGKHVISSGCYLKAHSARLSSRWEGGLGELPGCDRVFHSAPFTVFTGFSFVI